MTPSTAVVGLRGGGEKLVSLLTNGYTPLQNPLLPPLSLKPNPDFSVLKWPITPPANKFSLFVIGLVPVRKVPLFLHLSTLPASWCFL